MIPDTYPQTWQQTAWDLAALFGVCCVAIGIFLTAVLPWVLLGTTIHYIFT